MDLSACLVSVCWHPKNWHPNGYERLNLVKEKIKWRDSVGRNKMCTKTYEQYSWDIDGRGRKTERLLWENAFWTGSLTERNWRVFRCLRVPLQRRMTMKLSVKGSPPDSVSTTDVNQFPERRCVTEAHTHSLCSLVLNKISCLFLANSLCVCFRAFLGIPFCGGNLPSNYHQRCEDVDRDGKLLPDEFQILAPRLRIHRVIASMAGRFAAHLPEKAQREASWQG